MKPFFNKIVHLIFTISKDLKSKLDEHTCSKFMNCDKDSSSSWSQIFKTVAEMYLEPSQASTMEFNFAKKLHCGCLTDRCSFFAKIVNDTGRYSFFAKAIS